MQFLYIAFLFLTMQTQAQVCETVEQPNSNYFATDGYFREENNDWKAELCKFWVSSGLPEPPQEVTSTSPFFSNVPYNPNLFDLPLYNIPKDNEPIDGWVLVFKKFGTPTKPVPVPAFVLYNKYTGKVRTFALVFKNDKFPYDAAEVLVRHYNQSFDSKMSTLFSYQQPLSRASDIMDKALLSMAVNTPYSDGPIWLFNEFVANYDPCVCLNESWLNISITSKDVQYIKLESQGTEVGGYLYTPNPTTSDANFNIGKYITNTNSTANTGMKIYKTLSEFGSLIQKPLNDIDTNDINLAQGIKNVAAKTIKWGPYFGFAIAAIDFAVGSANVSTPAPKLTGFQSTFNYQTQGTLDNFNPAGFYLYSTPGSLIPEQLSTEIIPFYNKPLGTFSIVRTPRLQYGLFDLPCTSEHPTPGEYGQFDPHIPACWAGISTYPLPDQTYNSAEYFIVESVLKMDPIQYAFNPSSNLTINELKVALFFEPGNGNPNDFNLVEDETSGKWRTPYMVMGALEYYTINTSVVIPNIGGFEASLQSALNDSQDGLSLDCCISEDLPWFFPQTAELHVFGEFQPPLSCNGKGICSPLTQNIFFSARYFTTIYRNPEFTDFNYLHNLPGVNIDYPMVNPTTDIPQNRHFPSNNPSGVFTLQANIEVTSFNEMFLHLDNINLNNKTLFCHATAIYFLGGNLPVELIPFLGQNGWFNLPLGSIPSYDNQGYLNGYTIPISFTTTLNGIEVNGVYNVFNPINIPGIKIDLGYHNFPNRLPLKKQELEFYCKNIYNASFDKKMVIGPTDESETHQALIGNSIFPNPTEGSTILHACIGSEDRFLDGSILVSDASGRFFEEELPFIKNEETGCLDIDIHSIFPGFYYITIITENQVHTFPIIKN
jgi:hypothetical protein